MVAECDIIFVIGTRPEIIKMAPILRAIRPREHFDVTLIHTDQHYDEELSRAFFDSLNIELPDQHFDVGSGSQAEQTASGLIRIGQYLQNQRPDVVLAQGDTNAVLSTAIAASKLSVDFGHVEAGIRSFDRSMPEEVNRVISDHVADICFAPTDRAVENLASEGIKTGVFQTGNTVTDACLEHRSIAASNSNILKRFDLSSDSYAVATIHRPINTDDSARLTDILRGMDTQDYPVLLSCHPRTQTAIEVAGFEPSGNLKIVDPLDYLDFLKLVDNARFVVTDSGGIQEEASILEVPCLTVRPNTERPETLEAGVNRLVKPSTVDTEMSELYYDDELHKNMQGATQLYGDGHSSERIINILTEQYVS